MIQFIFSYCLLLLVLIAQPASAVPIGHPLPPDPTGTAPWVSEHREALRAQGYQPWVWSAREILPASEFVMLPVHPDMRGPRLKAFLQALSDNKAEIMQLYPDSYQVTDAEYILLARMAIGFLGNESNLFRGERYIIKESCIYCWVFAKWAGSLVGLAGNDTMSRGAIQMKEVPDAIEETYDIEPRDLNDPVNAARAIMGYLIESLRTLKRTASNNELAFVTPETYQDYLPFLYFGSSGSLKATPPPDPNHHGYILQMRHFMAMVEIYTR